MWEVASLHSRSAGGQLSRGGGRGVGADREEERASYGNTWDMCRLSTTGSRGLRKGLTHMWQQV